MSDTYDSAEAIEVLARAAEEVRRDMSGRMAASRRLLTDLAALNEPVARPVTILKGSNEASFALHEFAGIKLFVDQDGGGIRLIAMNGSLVPLEYDPVRERWQGKERDMELTVAPGNRRPKRSALAVLVEEVLKALRKTSRG